MSHPHAADTPDEPSDRPDVADSSDRPEVADAGEQAEVDAAADQLAAVPQHPDLRAALEAILLVVDEPVSDVMLAQVVERPTDEVTAELRALAEEYTANGRGMDLRRAAGGWRLYTREEFAPYVQRFILDGQQARLTQAALETLAVVAYRQPVSRSKVSAIRGVGVDGVMRTLLARGLVAECGVEHETGAHLYQTTPLFLEKLGLDSVDELPPLAPLLPDLDAVDSGPWSPAESGTNVST